MQVQFAEGLFAAGIRKRFGGRAALAGVDLRVSPGEIVALVGANGAGKSTLLQIVAGVLQADEGTVTVTGRAGAFDIANARGQLGFAPQPLALYLELTAAENAAFFGRLYGLHGAALRHRVEAALSFARLEERAADRVRTLSGGMQRRLHVACAIVHDPAIVLLDEPTAGVDAEARADLVDAIDDLRARGHAVAWTTHHLPEAARVSDRIVMMDEGRIVGVEPGARASRPDPVRVLQSVPLAAARTA